MGFFSSQDRAAAQQWVFRNVFCCHWQNLQFFG
jgi:hypothetical protein